MSLTLQVGTIPPDTALPATLNALFGLLPGYATIVGDEFFTGVIISDTQPSVDQQSLLWAKLNSSGRLIGIYQYNGGWNTMPTVAARTATAALPSSPVGGELIQRTDRGNGTEIYRDSNWTTFHLASGSTAERPTGVPVNYRYFDETIGTDLKYTASGWSTVYGTVGQTIMITGLSEAVALANNPGWATYTGFADKYLVGSSGTKAPDSTGGRDEFPVSWAGYAAERGSQEQGFVTNVTVDTVASATAASTITSGNGTVPLDPSYCAVLFLRKAF